jgi:predicted regulator of Ras-like GTPase activity (Roadblock/LC7/MglB family)
MSERNPETVWTKKAADVLVGAKITRVFYLSEAAAEEMMWNSRALMIELDNGQVLMPMADDEGNDAGALAYNDGILPVL